jgi:hypothetical protein
LLLGREYVRGISSPAPAKIRMHCFELRRASGMREAIQKKVGPMCSIAQEKKTRRRCAALSDKNM